MYSISHGQQTFDKLVSYLDFCTLNVEKPYAV